MTESPQSWGRWSFLGKEEQFQGPLNLPLPTCFPRRGAGPRGSSLHFLIPQHTQQLPWSLQNTCSHEVPVGGGWLPLLPCLHQFMVYGPAPQ
jgi:hypothetical protein